VSAFLSAYPNSNEFGFSTSKKKSRNENCGTFAFSGERGIRTPGTLQYNSFQDCRIRPLCHFSAAKVVIDFKKQLIL
jgi:hypothetical protein